MHKTDSPVLNSNAILLIGSGRLAKHLTYWNCLLETPNTILQWNRSQSTDILTRSILKADRAWLAISDSAIIPFYEKHLMSVKIPVLHFSGALFDSRIKSAHPLMSFSWQLLAPEVYAKIGFAITGSENLETLMPNFKNTFFKVLASDKPLYHALCVVAGNFPQLLWAQVSQHFKSLNIPEEAYHLYLSQVLQNFLTLSDRAITGPLVRNDQQTLEKNETSLAGTRLQSIYHSFRKEFSP